MVQYLKECPPPFIPWRKIFNSIKPLLRTKTSVLRPLTALGAESSILKYRTHFDKINLRPVVKGFLLDDSWVGGSPGAAPAAAAVAVVAAHQEVLKARADLVYGAETEKRENHKENNIIACYGNEYNYGSFNSSRMYQFVSRSYFKRARCLSDHSAIDQTKF